MPIRRGDEYLAGIRDGREVWLDGERVDDVTSHPRLMGFARTLAESNAARDQSMLPC